MFCTWQEVIIVHGHDKIFITKILTFADIATMLYTISFATTNIYNLRENTLTCVLKNGMTPDRKISQREFQLTQKSI